MGIDYDALKDCVINGNSNGATDNVNKLLENGCKAKEIIDDALVPAMDFVGEQFQKKEFFIPELLVAARAMEACLAILEPLLADTEEEKRWVALACTVKGDLHDIGKNIVAAMMKGAGFEIKDLGTDVSAEAIVEAVEENKPDIICLSALLTTTMKSMKDVIAALEQKGLRDKVKVIVGGAPLTQKYADEMGADAYGADAAEAVTKARELIA